jgi:hypothetical protein
MSGHDVYVLDNSSPGFSTSDSMGVFYPDDAIALIDSHGNVVQFLSWEGNTITATNGPAAGETSTNTGSITGANQSMQSDDGGQTYYPQNSTNAGAIPACYAPGTLLLTPDGENKIETLRVGDKLISPDGKAHTIRWVWSGQQPLDTDGHADKPVLVRQGALGAGKPNRDLIVSGQHRIVAGAGGQLDGAFSQPCMVPAKALIDLPGIRLMLGKRSITWHHVLCDTHLVVIANGCLSESLLLGPQIIRHMSKNQVSKLSVTLGRDINARARARPILPLCTVQAARKVAKRSRQLRPMAAGRPEAQLSYASMQ